MTVSELNRAVARLLEQRFPLVSVQGEVSNFTRAASGHWYFSLKDREAQVRCVMFRGRNQHLDWSPREGDKVEARAVVGLYTARGEFQLGVEHLARAGAGSLFEAFTRLKAKLEAEGLFDAGRKRAVPRFARSIGVITSLSAAALRDVLSTLARRAPHVRVVIYPAPVQGRDAAPRLAEALVRAGVRATHHAECDVLLLVRGGGSIEDLWAFNDEGLARTIAASSVPIVSGIGHETDFTIADFAADVRAPTPTAAAELASPDRSQLAADLVTRRDQMMRRMARRRSQYEQRLDDAARRLKSPAQRLAETTQHVGELALRLVQAERARRSSHSQRMGYLAAALRRARPDTRAPAGRIAALARGLAVGVQGRIGRSEAFVELAAARLVLLDPLAALARGYAIVTDERGDVVRDAARLAVTQPVRLRLAHGAAQARIESIDAPET
jgi:exodeoxyribonuclease VII large subunit